MNMRSKILGVLLFAIIFSGSAFASTIHGNVYDLSLNKVPNARVEIDTNPRQFVIAQNGSYIFNVPLGVYEIKAKLLQKNELVSSVEENITVKQDGDYVLDLILFPNIEEGVDDIEVNVSDDLIPNDMKNNKWIYAIILFVIAALFGFYFTYKNMKKSKQISEESNAEIDSRPETKSSEPDEDELDKLVEIIKKEGGRTTQKDIRKEIPLSEAKISLMIAELEHKGIVEKIKKGRGNIIILKKK